MAVLFLAGLEIAYRFGFARFSRIENRTQEDYAKALTVRPGPPGRPAILFLGNSLLLEALDYPGMTKALEPHATPVRFVIEQTSYLDWKYGIRRLLNSGVRPDRIILSMNIPMLAGNVIRGDYSAFYLLDTPDILSAGKEAGYDLTKTSSLYFARYSFFFASRNNFRNFILNKVHSGYGAVLHDFTTTGAKEMTDAEIIAAAAPRLAEFRQLCAQYNVRFDFLLPPGFGKGEQALIQAGNNSGVPVIVPVSLNEWKLDMYKDGFHVNQEGASQFTRRLAAKLLEGK